MAIVWYPRRAEFPPPNDPTPAKTKRDLERSTWGMAPVTSVATGETTWVVSRPDGKRRPGYYFDRERAAKAVREWNHYRI